MKLISLNIWGGKLFDQLLPFLKEQSKDIDIFCFQEVYRAESDRLISKEMHANIFGEIQKILSDYQGYFAPHLNQRDLEKPIDFPLESGLAIFIKKSIKVKECKDFFIYRSGLDLIDDDLATVPRNLQYISFEQDNKNYLVSHFHGIWYPKTKIDTSDRIQQSKKIIDFLSSRSELKLLCGDFNLLPDTESMKILEKGMRNLIREYDIKTTRNHFYERPEKQADYILTSPKIDIKQFRALDVLVSDHLPLYIEFD